MMKYSIMFLLGATTAVAQNTPPVVTHVWARQRPNTQVVDVNFSVEDVDNDALTVSLSLLDGNAVVILQCTSVTGDVGVGIRPGANKYVTWDAGIDFPGEYGSAFAVRVVADDGYSPPIPPGFVSIPPGTFIMGSPIDELGRYDWNETQHQVMLTHGFYCQATEVTNQQYAGMAQWAYDNGYVTAASTGLRDNLDGATLELLDLDSPYCEIDYSGGVFTCANPGHPVKMVNWYGAVAYCDWLSMQQGLPRAYDHSTWQCNGGDPYTAAGYRLPTEAEWEYVCRAGSTTAFANGQITYTYCTPPDPNLDQMGWYCGNAGGWTHPVAQKMPNAWSLYDMHGNLWAWINDWYGAYGGDVVDPVGPPSSGSGRVLRGGYWDAVSQHCRSAMRGYNSPIAWSSAFGFRSAKTWD